MKIFTLCKSPLFRILFVVGVFAVAGGFWYVNAPVLAEEPLEGSEIALVSELEEEEIVLGGEVSAVEKLEAEEPFIPEETLPLAPKTIVKKDVAVAVQTEPEIENADAGVDEEVEVIFECETGDEVVEG